MVAVVVIFFILHSRPVGFKKLSHLDGIILGEYQLCPYVVLMILPHFYSYSLPMFRRRRAPNRRRAALKTPPPPVGGAPERMAAARCKSIELGRPELAPSPEEGCRGLASTPRGEERVGTPEVERRDGEFGDAETLSSRAGGGGFRRRRRRLRTTIGGSALEGRRRRRRGRSMRTRR